MQRLLLVVVVALSYALLLAGAAATSHAEERCIPIVLLYDDEEKLKEKRTDTNRDCNHDEIIYYEAGNPLRSEHDTDHDQKIDAWMQYTPPVT